LFQTGEVARDTNFANQQNSTGECVTETIIILKLFKCTIMHILALYSCNLKMLLPMYS